MKKYLTTILLLGSLLLDELHTFFQKASLTPVNWIITKPSYAAMPVQQNIKMVTDQLWFTLIFCIMLVLLRPDQRNRINKTTILSFILYSIISTAFYFYNYKTTGFEYVYVALFMSWPIIYMMQRKRKQVNKTGYLYEQLNWE